MDVQVAYPFEITNEKHMKCYDYARTIYRVLDEYETHVYLQGCDVVDPTEFLKEFGRFIDPKIVDYELLESLKNSAQEKNVDWATDYIDLLPLR